MIGDAPLVVATERGLECPAGGFHVDPWQPVPFAIVTHAHADRVVPGCGRYVTSFESAPLIKLLLKEDVRIDALDWGITMGYGDAVVSLHPSGHILGAAQVRIEVGAEVWVVAPDWKRAPDPTSSPFEVVRCDAFVTGALYALPIFRWPSPATVADEVVAWWEKGRELERPSVVFARSPGTAERLLALVRERTYRAVRVHPSLEATIAIYRRLGKPLADTLPVLEGQRRRLAGELVIAPPTAEGREWAKRIPNAERALASGTMRIRAFRTRATVDRGFILSEHPDWKDLEDTIVATEARRVFVTHGRAHVLARSLSERGLEALPIETPWVSDEEGS